MLYEEIEDSWIYQEAEEIADAIWDVVVSWDHFAQDTVGKQMVRAGDSIGANIAESAGRFHPKDAINFIYHSRDSLKETKFWLRRARRRRLIDETIFNQFTQRLDKLASALNNYIRSQRNRLVKEDVIEYIVNDSADPISTNPQPPHQPTNKPTRKPTR